MTTRTWVRNLLRRPSARTICKASHRARLNLEALEDRVVLSEFTASTLSQLILDIQYSNATPEADTITLAPGSNFTLAKPDNYVIGRGASGLPIVTGSAGLRIIGNGGTIRRSTAPDTPTFRRV